MLKNYIHQLLKFFYPLVKKLMPFQVYAYLAVGAFNTILNIGLFIVLFFFLANTFLAVEVATVISFVVTVITGFWLNKNFAFTEAGNEKRETKKQFGKYALVALQGQVSAYLLTKGMIIVLSMNASEAYFITSIIMLTLNYFLQKYFTFRNKNISMKHQAW
jgi:putative flippase GtrA